MKFHVLTLFPEMIENGCNTSITGRAISKGLIQLNIVNIRDFSKDKHKKVDDYPYGGGAGMLMQAQPIYDAYLSLKTQPKTRVVFMTPQGRTFNQKMATELASEDEIVFLCGHYEGVDERVLEKIVTDEISVGDYVLTGGELPAMVVMDAVSRLKDGVLNNEDSANDESFSGYLLEYPQYSRPEQWNGVFVPEVLLSGNHEKIGKWRLEKSIERTQQKRPDLYSKYCLNLQIEDTKKKGKKATSKVVIKADNLEKIFTRNQLPSEKRKTRKVSSKVEFSAVNHVSLSAGRGEVVGILGPNGAGKTTLLRMLGKLMTPSSGEVSIYDNDGKPLLTVTDMKREIGYLSGNTKLYARLSTREMLAVLGDIYGLDKKQCNERIDEICKVLGMEAFIDNRIEKLSTGQTQRANIARCLVHSPQVYIFDEPTLGLDIISSDKIIDFMKKERVKGKTILYSTHYMEEAQYLCDRIIMMHNGTVIAQGTPDELMRMTNTVNLRETFHSLVEVSDHE